MIEPTPAIVLTYPSSYDYYEIQLQEAYNRGEFEPRGQRQHKSGLVIDFLVPPRYDDSFLDGPGF